MVFPVAEVVAGEVGVAGQVDASKFQYMRRKVFFGVFWVLLIIGLWGVRPLFKINKVDFQQSPTLTPVIQKPILRFSVIGDPESDLKNLEKALEISKNNNDEFVIIVGDLTQVGTKEQLLQIKKVLDASGLTYYVIPGNHDLYSSRRQTKDPLRYYQEIFGRPYYQVLQETAGQKIKFLFLNNSDEYRAMGEEQIKFIKESFSSNSAQMFFVFLHIPIYHPTSDYIMGYRNEEVSRQKDELLNIFKKGLVKGIFAGHLHKTSSYEGEGIKMYIAGSVNSSRNWQTPRFLEVKIFKNGEFIVREVEL